jgi:hypothetical protein
MSAWKCRSSTLSAMMLIDTGPVPRCFAMKPNRCHAFFLLKAVKCLATQLRQKCRPGSRRSDAAINAVHDH